MLRLLGKWRCGERLPLNVTGLGPPMSTSSALNTLACMEQVCSSFVESIAKAWLLLRSCACVKHTPASPFLLHLPCLSSSASPLHLRPCLTLLASPPLPDYPCLAPASPPLPHPLPHPSLTCPPLSSTSLQQGASAHAAAQQLPQLLSHNPCPRPCLTPL